MNFAEMAITKRCRFIPASLFLLLPPCATHAQFTSADTLSWSVADDAQCIKAGDLDNDGDNELVVGTLGGHHLLVYWNPGDGGFGTPELFMETEGVYDLELVDLDLDNDSDVVVGDFGNGWVAWRENLGNGTWGPREVLADDIHTTGITALEVRNGDADALPELFTLTYVGRVGWFQNDGTSTFGSPQTLMIVGNQAFGLAVGELNGIVGNEVIAGGQELWYRLNSGVGYNISAAVEASPVAGGVRDIVILNNSGGANQAMVACKTTNLRQVWGNFATTAVVVSSTSIPAPEDIEVHERAPGFFSYMTASAGLQGVDYGLSNGYITERRAYGIRSLCVADLNGDGQEDVAMAGDEDDDVAWLPYSESGVPIPEIRLTPYSGGTALPGQGDLDGDGDVDLVIPFNGGRAIGWIANNGTGAFGPIDTVTTRAYDHFYALPADLDGDGDLDVLTAFGSDSLLYYPNNGAGNFGTPITLSTTVCDGSLLDVADLDGDGDPDILTRDLVGAGPSWQVRWLENEGGGQFAERSFTAGNVLFYSLVGDLDDDGLQDVLYSTSNQNVGWYRNLGGGVFDAAAVLFTVSQSGTVTDLALADVEGDGDTDLLIAGAGGANVQWMERTASGLAAPALLLTDATMDVRDMMATDMDLDGDDDLLIGMYDGGRVVYYTNENGTTFAPGVLLTDEMVVAEHVDAVDLNADGRPDALAASHFSDRVLAFMNTTDIMTTVPELTDQLLAVPNPATGSFVLELPWNLPPSGQVSVRDAMGRLVHTTSGNGSTRLHLACDAYAPGTYTVHLTDAGRTLQLRVVVL